jgi:transposase
MPEKHLLRTIDRVVELNEVRAYLAPFYSETGRPSIDPEPLIRMLIIGYCFGIRSERRLCEEVHLNLAYRSFCRLGLDGAVPDHSTFSKNRMAAFARAICCGGCSRPSCGAASTPDWSGGLCRRCQFDPGEHQ